MHALAHLVPQLKLSPSAEAQQRIRNERAQVEPDLYCPACGSVAKNQATREWLRRHVYSKHKKDTLWVAWAKQTRPPGAHFFSIDPPFPRVPPKQPASLLGLVSSD